MNQILRPLAVLLMAVAASAATPAETGNRTDPAGEPATYMFVQTGKKGTLAPKPGKKGEYALTLEDASPRTIFFTDRPARNAGSVPTGTFLKGFSFEKGNPPNAALVAAGPDGSESVAVVELTSPKWDAAAKSLSYDAKLLERSDKGGLASFHARSKGLPGQFVDGSLFIDDCSRGTITCGCYDSKGQNNVSHSLGNLPRCYDWGAASCGPCNRSACIIWCEANGYTNDSACVGSSCYYRCGKAGHCAAH